MRVLRSLFAIYVPYAAISARDLTIEVLDIVATCMELRGKHITVVYACALANQIHGKMAEVAIKVSKQCSPHLTECLDWNVHHQLRPDTRDDATGRSPGKALRDRSFAVHKDGSHNMYRPPASYSALYVTAHSTLSTA